LRGKCAYCKRAISFLYPFIEILSAALLYLMVITFPSIYWPAYFIFISALIVTIRTDIETMLISRFASVFLIPIGLLLSYFGMLPLSPEQSIIGALSGYAFLYATCWIYYKITHRIGMGQGDIELIGMIGSFLGSQGWWFSLMIGSLAGSLAGIVILCVAPNSPHKINPGAPGK
jgi:leader peptidase (prepilin peptidase)/N-methyltransferase